MSYEDEILDRIRQGVLDGDKEKVIRETRAALDAGVDPLDILHQGLTRGADEVGARFQDGSFFLPQLMLAGVALRAAMEFVVPLIKAQHPEGGAPDTGTVVLATVQTDVHDIGKNLVGSMLTAGGFTVYDLGVDVPLDSILSRAREVKADIIGCSALLTTSMPYMRDLIGLLQATGLRRQFRVMVGGASVTPDFAAQIGADGTASDAIGAVTLARQLIRQQQTVTP